MNPFSQSFGPASSLRPSRSFGPVGSCSVSCYVGAENEGGRGVQMRGRFPLGVLKRTPWRSKTFRRFFFYFLQLFSIFVFLFFSKNRISLVQVHGTYKYYY